MQFQEKMFPDNFNSAEATHQVVHLNIIISTSNLIDFNKTTILRSYKILLRQKDHFLLTSQQNFYLSQ